MEIITFKVIQVWGKLFKGIQRVIHKRLEISHATLKKNE